MRGNPNIKDHGFKKGKSGNPNGRPKLPDLSEAMAKVLSGEDEDGTGLKEILSALKKKALKGSEKAAEILLDRGFGKAKQSLDVTSGGKPFIFELDEQDKTDPETDPRT